MHRHPASRRPSRRFLASLGYRGAASLECHGTAGWPPEKAAAELRKSDAYVRSCPEEL